MYFIYILMTSIGLFLSNSGTDDLKGITFSIRCLSVSNNQSIRLGWPKYTSIENAIRSKVDQIFYFPLMNVGDESNFFLSPLHAFIKNHSLMKSVAIKHFSIPCKIVLRPDPPKRLNKAISGAIHEALDDTELLRYSQWINTISIDTIALKNLHSNFGYTFATYRL